MSPKLGGHQKGTMAQVFGYKNGPVIVDSVGNQKVETLLPHLNQVLPIDSPLFTDMGYKWVPRKNLRLVNHSAHSKDKRYKWARNRWVTEYGVNNNVAEGLNSVLKKYVSGYGWFKPEYSQLYLNEFSFLKSMRHLSWEGVAKYELAQRKAARPVETDEGEPKGRTKPVTIRGVRYTHRNLASKLVKYHFHPATLEERLKIEESKSRFKYNDNLKAHFDESKNPLLFKEMDRFTEYYSQPRPYWITKKEEMYSTYAEILWQKLPYR